MDPLGCAVRRPGCYFGSLAWSCGSYKAISLTDLCLQSCSKILSKCSAVVTDSIRLWPPILFSAFCPIYQSQELIHLQRGQPEQAGWPYLLCGIWTLWKESFQTGSKVCRKFNFLLWVCSNNRPISMRKPRGMACKRSVTFFKPFQVEDLEDYFGGFAILLSAQASPRSTDLCPSW